MRKYVTYLLLVPVLIAITVGSCFIAHASSKSNYVLYVMGDSRCPSCSRLEEFLRGVGLNYCLCPLSNSTCLSKYYWLVNTFKLPTYIPLTIVIANSTVKAVVIGAVTNESFWINLIRSYVSDEVPYYYGTKLVKYLGIDPKELLKHIAPQYLSSEDIACNGDSSPPPLPITLGALVSLALSDSVNPCATYIYVALLTSVALSEVGRRRRVLAVAAAFIAAVFTGYYLLGLGIMNVFKFVPTFILGGVAVAYGAFVIFRAVRERSKCVAPSRGVTALLEKAKASILFSLALGFVVTFTLLPCSSGPYLVFAGIASRYALSTSLALLGLYNLIFVLPLIALAVLIAESMKYERVRGFMIKYRTHLSVIAGLTLIALGIYIVVNPA